ncbi:MAG TPA: hypothetical protein VK659_05865 [Asanoa sp.]|nr:hypothetical protein [Asanoa sp.]
MVAFQSDGDPAGSGHGIGPRDWGHTLQRFREGLESLYAGDQAHVFVPETEVYILEIATNDYRESGKGWVAWRTGQPPTSEFAEYGLFFDPASEWNLDGELVYRPFPMVDDGAQVADSRGRQWIFTAPFSFTSPDGQRGTPTWPLAVAGNDERTKTLNGSRGQRPEGRMERALGRGFRRLRSGVARLVGTRTTKRPANGVGPIQQSTCPNDAVSTRMVLRRPGPSVFRVDFVRGTRRY